MPPLQVPSREPLTLEALWRLVFDFLDASHLLTLRLLSHPTAVLLGGYFQRHGQRGALVMRPRGTLQKLRLLMPGLPRVRLNLRGHKLRDKGAVLLTTIVRQNPNVTAVEAPGNSIGPQGGIAIADSLKHNRSLVTLDLQSNEVAELGTIAFGRCLASNMCLRRLILSDNRIGVQGISALAAGLKHNSTLVELGLAFNNTTNQGAIALAAALSHNQRLELLTLWRNNIGDEGAIAIACALRTNACLQQLDLAFNKISDKAALSLAETLRSNLVLGQVNLAGNPIGERGIAAIAQAVEQRSDAAGKPEDPAPSHTGPHPDLLENVPFAVPQSDAKPKRGSYVWDSSQRPISKQQTPRTVPTAARPARTPATPPTLKAAATPSHANHRRPRLSPCIVTSGLDLPVATPAAKIPVKPWSGGTAPDAGLGADEPLGPYRAAPRRRSIPITPASLASLPTPKKPKAPRHPSERLGPWTPTAEHEGPRAPPNSAHPERLPSPPPRHASVVLDASLDSRPPSPRSPASASLPSPTPSLVQPLRPDNRSPPARSPPPRPAPPAHAAPTLGSPTPSPVPKPPLPVVAPLAEASPPARPNPYRGASPVLDTIAAPPGPEAPSPRSPLAHGDPQFVGPPQTLPRYMPFILPEASSCQVVMPSCEELLPAHATSHPSPRSDRVWSLLMAMDTSANMTMGASRRQLLLPAARSGALGSVPQSTTSTAGSGLGFNFKRVPMSPSSPAIPHGHNRVTRPSLSRSLMAVPVSPQKAASPRSAKKAGSPRGGEHLAPLERLH